MTIAIELSPKAEQALRDAWGQDLPRATLEALTIEGYRSGKLSAAEVGQVLSLEDRWAVEQWLAQRQVPLNYTLADLEADRNALDRVLGPAPR